MMEESNPILEAILRVRHRAAADFSPEYSGQRGQDFDRGLMAAYEAVYQALLSAA